MKNIKNIIFIVAIIANLQSNIMAMDSSSRPVATYPAWTMKEREIVLAGIEKNRVLRNAASSQALEKPRVSAYFINYQQQEQVSVKITDLTLEQKQQKRAEIIANLAQQDTATIEASKLIKLDACKDFQKRSGMSDQEFIIMTKELLSQFPRLSILDDL